jgi:hypothetical protein
MPRCSGTLDEALEQLTARTLAAAVDRRSAPMLDAAVLQQSPPAHALGAEVPSIAVC